MNRPYCMRTIRRTAAKAQAFAHIKYAPKCEAAAPAAHPNSSSTGRRHRTALHLMHFLLQYIEDVDNHFTFAVGHRQGQYDAIFKGLRIGARCKTNCLGQNLRAS